MFKRVKSLVLAGALVLGMAVPAFAAKTTLETVKDNYLGKMVAGSCENDIDGTSIRTITRDDYVSEEDLKAFIKGINEEKDATTNNRLVITKYEDGINKPPYKQYKVYFDADSDNEIDEPGDTLIETINIEINNEAAGGKGVFDIISPETGDMIAYGGLAIAAIAGAGLYISNKKRK